MKCKAICLIFSFILLNTMQAKAGFEICGDFKQGELLIFKNVPEDVESLNVAIAGSILMYELKDDDYNG